MLVLLMFSVITFLICNIIMLLASFLSKKTIIDREKVSPYECGFDPKSSARLPFSLRFFLIAVIFLIFDVEITLLLPIASIFNLANTISWLVTSAVFLLILLFGLYYEWMQGALEWAE
uniref:NADH-ubiquinone oxidoreductase chain 3 n=1 Tax=Metacarcinus magister TaxID=29965 RepID=A0A7G7WQE7_METMG|nr:NADH dehydrogenase subunit 3 [Metacarcinus magister]QNH68774.1 NADH dehydrogenase subunit 3 [Metacarcinus magister]